MERQAFFAHSVYRDDRNNAYNWDLEGEVDEEENRIVRLAYNSDRYSFELVNLPRINNAQFENNYGEIEFRAEGSQELLANLKKITFQGEERLDGGKIVKYNLSGFDEGKCELFPKGRVCFSVKFRLPPSRKPPPMKKLPHWSLQFFH